MKVSFNHRAFIFKNNAYIVNVDRNIFSFLLLLVNWNFKFSAYKLSVDDFNNIFREGKQKLGTSIFLVAAIGNVLFLVLRYLFGSFLLGNNYYYYILLIVIVGFVIRVVYQKRWNSEMNEKIKELQNKNVQVNEVTVKIKKQAQYFLEIVRHIFATFLIYAMFLILSIYANSLLGIIALMLAVLLIMFLSIITDPSLKKDDLIIKEI